MNIISIAGIKRGMTQVVVNGKVCAITLFEITPHELFRIKTKKQDGYNAICFSAGEEVATRKVSKPMLTQFQSRTLKPRREMFEVRVNSTVEEFKVEGEAPNDEFFENLIGTTVDVQGISSGKGFAGAMKRHNFRGLEATHGVSITHRSHGSTGQRQDPGKVFKGKKMAGHMGATKVTVQNLKVVLFDKELKLLGVQGAVPGNDNCVAYIKTAAKGGNKTVVEAINGLKVIY